MSNAPRDELAAALEAMASGQQPSPSQTGQSESVIGPAPVVPPRPVGQASRKKSDPFFLQRTLIPPLLTLGILLPALALFQHTLSADDPLSAKSLPGVSLTLILAGALALTAAILNMLSVRKKLKEI